MCTAKGLQQEGIYRVNGNARIMDNLKVSFDRVGDADLTNKDIFSVGGVLKLFLVRNSCSLIRSCTVFLLFAALAE